MNIIIYNKSLYNAVGKVNYFTEHHRGLLSLMLIPYLGYSAGLVPMINVVTPVKLKTAEILGFSVGTIVSASLLLSGDTPLVAFAKKEMEFPPYSGYRSQDEEVEVRYYNSLSTTSIVFFLLYAIGPLIKAR